MTEPSNTESGVPKGWFRDVVPLPDRKEVGWSPYLFQLIERYILPCFLFLLIVALVMLAPTLALFGVALIALLTPCILLHEWAHYRVARKAGLGVDEFSVGMGSRVWTRVSKKTGVRWSVKALPIGGSVTVQGMTVEDTEKNDVPDAKAYIYASIWTRVKLSLGGVVVNAVLALIAFTLISLIQALEHGLPFWASLLSAPLAGMAMLGMLIGITATSLWNVVASLGMRGDVSSLLTAPGSIQAGLSEAVGSGISPILYFLMIFGALNVSLAILNILPIYMLDGGHALTALIDGARKTRLRLRGQLAMYRPLPARSFRVFNKATGFALISFICVIYGRDIVRLMTNSM